MGQQVPGPLPRSTERSSPGESEKGEREEKDVRQDGLGVGVSKGWFGGRKLHLDRFCGGTGHSSSSLQGSK